MGRGEGLPGDSASWHEMAETWLEKRLPSTPPHPPPGGGGPALPCVVVAARKCQTWGERRGQPYRVIIWFSSSSSNNDLAIAVAMMVSFALFLNIRCPFLTLRNALVLCPSALPSLSRFPHPYRCFIQFSSSSRKMNLAIAVDVGTHVLHCNIGCQYYQVAKVLPNL